MSNILIKGGTVVDGTGAAPFRADMRVRGDRIAEIATDLASEQGERLVDASGCYVTPGFIEAHTHYDAPMWWQPDLDPMPSYGITTIVMGKGGFSAAPISDDPEAQLEMIKIFSFFEDIPVGPFQKMLPWNWRKWSEYRRSMEDNVKVPANVAAFVGHMAIRLAVMGVDAWNRAATTDEVAQMAAHLDDALAAGAVGISSNLYDYDGAGRPVPTLLADDAEFAAIFEVMARYPNTSMQIIIDSTQRKTAAESVERLMRLIGKRKIRVQLAGWIPTMEHQKEILPRMLELREQAQQEGFDFWSTAGHVAPTITLSIRHSLIFAQSGDYVWHEVVKAETDEEKLRLLADPDWRARARESWKDRPSFTPMAMPHNLLLRNSANGVGPINLSLKDLAESQDMHISDALADWFIANGVESTVHMAPYPKNEEITVELLKRPKTVGNVNDAPAHGQMFCGAGENVLLFTKYVREGRITLEQAVHIMTGKLADYFNFTDRGLLKAGMRADIVIFNLNEVDRREEYKRYDVPTGNFGMTWRYTRDAAPMRMTIVNGVPTFSDGRFTGAFTGEYISPTASLAETAA